MNLWHVPPILSAATPETLELGERVPNVGVLLKKEEVRKANTIGLALNVIGWGGTNLHNTSALLVEGDSTTNRREDRKSFTVRKNACGLIRRKCYSVI